MIVSDNPLVSVVVITYNSAKTVLETLDSIAAQTYKNIELIISDDCSKDDTVKVCNEWLEKNRNRFVRTELITVVANTGVAGNINRGNNAANGQWLKGIAGDDILLPECVEQNINYVTEHPDAQLVFSKIVPFGSINYVDSEFYKVFLFGYGCLQLSDKEFFTLIRLRNFLPASTAFLQKSLFLELGGHDESIPLLEDWPFWIKASMNRVHFHFLPVETVKYRMEDSSLSIGKYSEAYLESCAKAYKFARNVQRNTNFLLWLYGVCNYSGNNHLIRVIGFIGKVFNPMSYYIKYLTRKVEKISGHLI